MKNESDAFSVIYEVIEKQTKENVGIGREKIALLENFSSQSGNITLETYYYEANVTGPKHQHSDLSEIYFVLEGRGKVTVEDEEYVLSPGAMVLIPPKKDHQTQSDQDSEMKFLAIFIPT